MSLTIDILPGTPKPFGVAKNNHDHNFAVFSKNATSITLLIYYDRSASPDHEICFDPTQNKTGDVWHVSIRGLQEPFYYSYKVSGPMEPEKGHSFDESLELLDPYSRMISGLDHWNDRPSDSRLLNYYETVFYDWEGDKPLNRALSDTIIYELHVRGFTRHESSKTMFPGTFRGLVEKIDYLKELGITAIELLPVHEFDETDCRFVNPVTGQQLLNYWGYSSLNFFAIKSAYASQGSGSRAAIEFRDMIKSFHKAGIEVILDVVFNHTAEGGNDRPTINFKGLENSVYYLLDEACDYYNYSGCGNTLNCNHPVVRKMILDSLHYFVVELHVDGFRFDLASILGRDEKGNVMPNPPLLELIAKDPILAKTKIIAEAWDASGLYQVGSFPASRRWAEWNDRYRDLIRRFCKREPGLIAELATRLSGSEDLYKHSDRNPFHSINFITAHDGFTLMDLVSYEAKHNTENGEQNRDGASENHSQNFGVEGPTNDPLVQEKRLVQIRNMAALLMISQGTPMLLSGDEFGNSQQGNNNAWCQDNPVSWLDWNLIETHQPLFRFWQKLIFFRKQHPALRRDQFFRGDVNPLSGLKDISWHNKRPFEPEFGSLNRSLAYMIDGVEGDAVIDDIIYVAINFNDTAMAFELPLHSTSASWQSVLDTADPQDFIDGRTKELGQYDKTVIVKSNSILVMTRPPELIKPK